MTSFYLSFSTDGKAWTPYKNRKSLLGNNDENTVVATMVEGVTARHLRVHPITWHQAANSWEPDQQSIR